MDQPEWNSLAKQLTQDDVRLAFTRARHLQQVLSRLRMYHRDFHVFIQGVGRVYRETQIHNVALSSALLLMVVLESRSRPVTIEVIFDHAAADRVCCVAVRHYILTDPLLDPNLGLKQVLTTLHLRACFCHTQHAVVFVATAVVCSSDMVERLATGADAL